MPSAEPVWVTSWMRGAALSTWLCRLAAADRVPPGSYRRRAGWPTDGSVALDRGPTSRRGEPLMFVSVRYCATARVIQGRDDAWNPTARKSKLVNVTAIFAAIPRGTRLERHTP